MQRAIFVIAIAVAFQSACGQLVDGYPKQKIDENGYILEVPSIPLTPPPKTTPRPTPAPEPKCLPGETKVGGRCQKPTPVVTTRATTRPPTTYLPPVTTPKPVPVTCRPGEQLRGNSCVAIVTTARPTPVPEVRCLPGQAKVGGKCVTPTQPPVKIDDGYCPSGLIKLPSGECGCASPLILVSGKCVTPPKPTVPPTVAPKCLPGTKLVGSSCVPVTAPTTRAPSTRPPSTYLPPVTCSAPKFLDKSGNCVLPPVPTTRPPVTAPRCLPGTKLVGSSCVPVTPPTTKAPVTTKAPTTTRPPTTYLPPVTTPKPATPPPVTTPKPAPPAVKCRAGEQLRGNTCVPLPTPPPTTRAPSTRPPSTYLPPVTCTAPKFLDKSGNCVLPPVTTTRPPVTAPRCLPGTKLVGSSCVPVTPPTTKAPVTTKAPITTRPPTTYLPPVTTPKPAPPSPVTTPKPAPPAVKCRSGEQLRGNTCVPLPTPPPTTRAPSTRPPSTYLPPVTCTAPKFLDKSGNCVLPPVTTPKPAPPRPVTTPKPAPPAVKCRSGEQLRGSTCVPLPTPPPTTRAPSTRPPSTYLPPVTCTAPKFLDKSGNCVLPPVTTTRPPVTAPRCLPGTSLVGGQCVPVTQPPVRCSPGETLVSGKCTKPVPPTLPPTKAPSTNPPSTYLPPPTCAPPKFLDNSGKCVSPTTPRPVPSLKCSPGETLIQGVCQKVTTTRPPSTYLPPVPPNQNKPDDYEAPPYLPPPTTTTVRTTPKPKPAVIKPVGPNVGPISPPIVKPTPTKSTVINDPKVVEPIRPVLPPIPRPPTPPTPPKPVTTPKPDIPAGSYVYPAPEGGLSVKYGRSV